MVIFLTVHLYMLNGYPAYITATEHTAVGDIHFSMGRGSILSETEEAVYDRFLPKCKNATVVAVAFEVQKISAILFYRSFVTSI